MASKLKILKVVVTEAMKDAWYACREWEECLDQKKKKLIK